MSVDYCVTCDSVIESDADKFHTFWDDLYECYNCAEEYFMVYQESRIG